MILHFLKEIKQKGNQRQVFRATGIPHLPYSRVPLVEGRSRIGRGTLRLGVKTSTF